MKIAIFSLTKNRLYYTKRTLESLHNKTHIPYDHYIIDQASTDGTLNYLNKHKDIYNLKIYPLGINIGINRGVNFAIDRIGDEADIILKLDNDVEIETDGWLKKCINVLSKKFVISPYVKGLINNRGGVNRYGHIKELNIGITPFIGGICMIGYRDAWTKDSNGWEFPVPKHAGGDRAFCMKLSLSGYKFGYVEDVVIKHVETTVGQIERYPSYFALRKQERVNII